MPDYINLKNSNFQSIPRNESIDNVDKSVFRKDSQLNHCKTSITKRKICNVTNLQIQAEEKLTKYFAQEGTLEELYAIVLWIKSQQNGSNDKLSKLCKQALLQKIYCSKNNTQYTKNEILAQIATLTEMKISLQERKLAKFNKFKQKLHNNIK